LAAQRGWVVLTKDDHIRRRPAERQASEAGKPAHFTGHAFLIFWPLNHARIL